MRIVWRVIGFAQRWRRLSSTCVEMTGSFMPARVTWEELPVSSADLSEWHMRENASVSLGLEGVRDLTLWELQQPLNIVSVHFVPGQLCSYSLAACVCSRNYTHLIISWCWQNYPIWEKGERKGEGVGERNRVVLGAMKLCFNLIFKSDGLLIRKQSIEVMNHKNAN